jgi:hypothetical protein
MNRVEIARQASITVAALIVCLSPAATAANPMCWMRFEKCQSQRSFFAAG